MARPAPVAHRREQAIEALAAVGILRFGLKKHAE
jgi:hypothetical protein